MFLIDSGGGLTEFYDFKTRRQLLQFSSTRSQLASNSEQEMSLHVGNGGWTHGV